MSGAQKEMISATMYRYCTEEGFQILIHDIAEIEELSTRPVLPDDRPVKITIEKVDKIPEKYKL